MPEANVDVARMLALEEEYVRRSLLGQASTEATFQKIDTSCVSDMQAQFFFTPFTPFTDLLL